MPDIVNPYIPGQPVDDASLFFGRRDVAAAIRENLVKGRRVFFIAGAPRIGKTSLLRQLPAFLPKEFVSVRLDLEEAGVEPLDRLLWHVAVDVASQAGPQLDANIPEPPWGGFEANTDRLLDDFWPEIRALLGERGLVFLVDDVDSLAGAEGDLLGAFISVLGSWRDRDEGLAVVVSCDVARQQELSREFPHLFGGALAFTLGPLSGEDANRLITWPVDGVLTYDYGLARRVTEITSGQPYFLQLLCFEVFNRCAPAGWVNQHDVDLVVEDLVGREIAGFREVWDESAPEEQLALAALVSLRGARGVATVREVRTILTKAGARVEQAQVAAALDALAARGILERLGALSYRFRVALTRDWLAERVDLAQVVRDTRWAVSGRGKPLEGRQVSRLRAGKQAKKAEPRDRAEAVAAAAGGEEPAPTRRIPWLWIGAAVLAVIVVVIVAAVLFRPAGVEPEPTESVLASPTARVAIATRTPTPTPTSRPAVVASPTATEMPTPTLPPSPTPPVVIARSVPAIAYQSREEGDDRWWIYVMGSDGRDPVRIGPGQSGFLSSPSWSPDGGRLAFVSEQDGNPDVWVMDIDGSNLVNLTQEKAKDHSPAWSPDGEWIAFASVRDSLYWELYVMRTDGSDVQRLTWWEDASDLSPTWSPDGTRLAFASKRDENWEIYTMDREGGNLVRLTDDPADDTNPAWSPDGGRIAFVSTRDGYPEIYVMAITGGEAVNVSNLAYSSEHGPTWSPDGGRIAFYSDRDGEWDVWVMGSDGSDPVKLTGDATNDQVPIWRP